MKIWISFFFILSLVACNQVSKEKTTDVTEVDSKVYLERGQEITGEVFVTLAATLQKRIKEGGVSNAIEYCNLAALPIVDSLSKKHNAQIRRSSLKERNPANSPSAEELVILNEYQKEKSSGSKIESKVIIDGQNILYYQPIMINNFCLQCHGEIGSDIAESDYAIIKNLYPADKAYGYKDGDLRGIWSIRFGKGI